MDKQKTITVCALSTIDNPFNPIDDYDQWLSYDVSHGYNTSNWLANLAKTSDLLPNQDSMREIEEAIDDSLTNISDEQLGITDSNEDNLIGTEDIENVINDYYNSVYFYHILYNYYYRYFYLFDN